MGNSFTDKAIEEGIGGNFQNRVDALNALGDAPKPKSRSTAHEEADEPEPIHRSRPRVRYGLDGVLRGEILRSQWLLKQIPLAMLIIFYFVLFISNRYRVEDLAKERIELKERINFLREHQIQMQKQYQESITISTIAKRLDSSGVGIIGGPPYEIKANEPFR